MKTFRVGPHEPAVLGKQLSAAGVPVETIRSGFAGRRDRTAMYGVVFTKDSADDLDVLAVIVAHSPKDAPSEAKSAPEVAAAQDRIINGPVKIEEAPPADPVVVVEPTPTPAPVFCNVCGLEITQLAEQIDRIYLIKATGRKLPPQKKHDACDLEYAKKKGLEKVSG